MSPARWLAPLAAVLTLAALSRVAAACDARGPFVAVRFSGPSAEAFERAVLADLEAGLSRSDLGVCRVDMAIPSAAARYLAELSVDATSTLRVELRVRVRDGKAELRLDRHVELAQVPADSRAFAVALAADELLRATGLEWLGGVAGEPEAVPSSMAPPPPLAVNAESPTPARAGTGSWSVGLRPALERFGGGQTLWGVDAALLVPLPARLELQLAPGLRRGLAVSTPSGNIESSALSLAVSARYRLIDAGWQLAAGIGLHALRMELEGVSRSAEITAAQLDGLALYGQGGLSASVPLAGPLGVELSGVVGAPLRALEATADGRAATAASGPQLGLYSTLLLQL